MTTKSRRTRADGPRPIDPDQRKHRLVTTQMLSAEEQVFISSVAAGNGIGEAEVFRIGLHVLRTLGKLGCTEDFVTGPFGDDDSKTRVMVGLNLSRAVFKIEDYPNLITPSDP